LHALSEEGAQLTDVHSAVIERIPAIEGQARMVAAEAYDQFEGVIAGSGEQIDPRVRSRILRGKDLSSADYIRVRRERERLIRDWAEEFDRFDIWLLPTVPQVAPLLNPLLSDDAAYFRLNAAMLRNPGLINFLDGCAISLPCHPPGGAPVGLMAVAPGGHDARLLNIAGAIEAALASFGGATYGRANYFGARVA
jgi:aspartyl-tRNA(Asn)/glutamyl-tRNA(Gln) amidotransferase subunit A